jgi:hypothetical protein
MRITAMSELPTLTPGEPVMALKGEIKEVGKYYSGTNAKGPWSFQKLLIRDASGLGVVKLKDRPALAADRVGSTVFITATQTAKHGWNGIKIDDDDFQGTITRLARVTASADLQFPTDQPTLPVQPAGATGQVIPSTLPPAVPTLTPTPAPSPTPEPPPPAPVPTGQTIELAGTARSAKANGENETNATRALYQRANMMVRCIAAAYYVAERLQKLHNITISPEESKTVASSLFISMDKGNMSHLFPGEKSDK